MYLSGSDIKKAMRHWGRDRLHILPLLEESQIGEVSVDFRLGTDFLVGIQGRASSIDITMSEDLDDSTSSFFQETRRLVGEPFVIHPKQIVLAVTLEYIKLPSDLAIELNMRSSYSRLGLSISSFIQPGYCGCIPIELINNSGVPIKLRVGSRIIQGRFSKVSKKSSYFRNSRKYVCNVRPVVSSASFEKDIGTLKNIFDTDHYITESH